MCLKTTSRLFAFLAMSFMVFNCSNPNAEKATDVNAETTAISDEMTTADPQGQQVAPPLENVDVPFQSFSVPSTSAQTLTLDNGSSIEVPAAAFVDKKGEPVNEPVEIRYREFHDAAEIIASGIPMSVETGHGKLEYMQTAGMFELKGYTANQEEVFIADGKEVVVNMASSVAGDYDFWYFDPEAGNWESQATVGAQPNPQRAAAESELRKLTQQAARPPVKPVLFDRSKPALNFQLSYEDFPGLKDKRGIVWQYAGTDEKKDPANNAWIFEKQWEDIKLEGDGLDGKYQLTLVEGATEYSIPVYPSQKGQDYEEAKAAYEKKLAAYQAVRETLKNRQAIANQKRNFLRSYKVNNFGIYNYDILYKMPDRMPLAADFDFEGLDNQEMLKPMVTVYLITGDQRAIIPYGQSAWDRFSFDPKADNQLVAIIPGNRIATFSPEDFKEQLPKIRQSNGKYMFRMKVSDQPVESVADMQEQILI